MSRLSPLLLFGAALLLYVSFQSISLDDFDSVSFALALDHFDIALQQPHPPGFPVYVAAGRVIRLLTGDPRMALTLLSAISGAVGVAALASLGAEAGIEAGAPSAGVMAGLGLLVLPGFWLTSEMALSDVPGLALMLVALACLWKARRADRWLLIGGVLAGLCLGLRPQNAVPIALFGVYIIVVLLRRDGPRALRLIASSLVMGGLAVLLWLLPTLSVSGGWNAYQSLVSAHGQHVAQIDSLFAQPISTATLATRIDAFAHGLVALVGGEPVLAVLTLIALLIGLVRVRWRTPLAWLCVLWFFSDAAQVFLLESLERPRLYLTFVPPLLLLASLGWTTTAAHLPRASRVEALTVGIRHGIGMVVIRMIPLALLGAFLLAVLPLAATLTHEPSPPVQAAQYIAAHYPTDQTVIVSLGSFRHAQIGLANYPQLYLGQFDAADWKASMASRQPTNLVLLDRDDIWPDAYAALTEGGTYVPVEDRVFRRDPRAFPQHSLVRMQVLTPLRKLSPTQLALPASGEIRVSDEASGKYFGEGWYRAEDVAGSASRWTQQIAVIHVALPPVDMTLTLEAVSLPADQTVSVTVNDQLLGTLDLHDPWQPLTLSIPGSALVGHPISTITLHHRVVQTPPGSSRELAVAYRVLRFTP